MEWRKVITFIEFKINIYSTLCTYITSDRIIDTTLPTIQLLCETIKLGNVEEGTNSNQLDFDLDWIELNWIELITLSCTKAWHKHRTTRRNKFVNFENVYYTLNTRILLVRSHFFSLSRYSVQTLVFAALQINFFLLCFALLLVQNFRPFIIVCGGTTAVPSSYSNEILYGKRNMTTINKKQKTKTKKQVHENSKT